MARVTVEDCLDKVDNRFQLVLVATKRARQLSNGVQPLVEWENDKPTIVALREIAEGLIGPSILDEPVHPVFEEEEEVVEGAEAATAEATTAEATKPHSRGHHSRGRHSRGRPGRDGRGDTCQRRTGCRRHHAASRRELIGPVPHPAAGRNPAVNHP